MTRRYVRVSLKHMSLLERQVVKVEIVNKHHEDWLGWEPVAENFIGKEFEIYRDCETEGEFKKAVGNLSRRVGGPQFVTEVESP